MSDSSDRDLSPMAVAMRWVSRVTGVVLMMVLPGLLGIYLDKRWGTGFCVLIGFAFGLAVGIWMLTQFVQPTKPTKRD